MLRLQYTNSLTPNSHHITLDDQLLFCNSFKSTKGLDVKTIDILKLEEFLVKFESFDFYSTYFFYVCTQNNNTGNIWCTCKLNTCITFPFCSFYRRGIDWMETRYERRNCYILFIDTFCTEKISRLKKVQEKAIRLNKCWNAWHLFRWIVQLNSLEVSNE